MPDASLQWLHFYPWQRPLRGRIFARACEQRIAHRSTAVGCDGSHHLLRPTVEVSSRCWALH